MAILSLAGGGLYWRGYINYASSDYSTVAGGSGNAASGGGWASVGGGNGNIASGMDATVPGGVANQALGLNSFAAGCHAIANYPGSFVWGGTGQTGCFLTEDTVPGQFVAYAPGGFNLYSEPGGASGVTLKPGSGSWSSLSDRSIKAHFLPIDAPALLEKIAAMPISTWNYKAQDDSIRHLGPTAQDFHEAFGLGEDDKHISTVDAQGVALAGIQALYQTVMQLKQNLADKDQEIAELRARLANPVPSDRDRDGERG
jgi:hypothetical protein